MSKMDLLAQAVRDLAHGNHADVHISLDAYDTYTDDGAIWNEALTLDKESAPE